MYVHRTVQCVAGYVSTQRRCGCTTGPLDLLRINLNLLARNQWRSTRLEQCQVSRLAKTARAKPKERARARTEKARCKGKKGEKSKDQKSVTEAEQCQGYCGYCEKWIQKRADCRKRIADGKSKGGAAVLRLQ